MGSLLYYFLSVVFFRNADDTPLGLTISKKKIVRLDTNWTDFNQFLVR